MLTNFNKTTSFRVSDLLIASFVSASVLLTAGCGIGSVASSADLADVTIGGNVHGGQQPVTGSHVALFATTSAGYGGSLTPLATTTTNGSGNFAITGSYTCPTGQQAYIVATGGNPGLPGTVDNSAIFLVAALGPCGGVSGITIVDINEVTTVAAAYALSGFAPAGGAGMTEAAVVAGTAMAGITTSSTNVQGLTDASANAGNIVNIQTGLAYTATPTTAANGIVPQSTIHALADILQTCVNATDPTSGNCPSIFTDATPPAGSGISKPANIFQAALDIAQYPGNNVGALFALISTQPAFGTTLTAAPNDWTIGITYTSSLLTSGTGLGINALDQVFVSGAGYLIDFTAQGAPLTSTSLLVSDTNITVTDTLREIAFDTTGNLFVTDGAYTGVYEYNPTSTTVTPLNFDVAPTTEANNNTYGVAVDGKSDVWTSSYSKATCATVTCPLIEFPATATPANAYTSGSPLYPAYTPFSSFPNAGVTALYTAPQPTNALGGARGLAFDVKTGNVWVTAIDDNLAEVFPVTPGTNGVATASTAPIQITGLGTEAGTPATNTAYGSISVAIDSGSRGWIVIAGGAAVTGSKATAAIPAAIYPVTISGGMASVGTAVTGSALSTPAQVAIDGNNNLFVANGSGSATASSVVEYSPALSSFLSPATGFIPSSTGVVYEPSYLAIDRSGAVWTLSSGSGTTHPANLLQILGVAAPVDPVLADGKYGVKP